MAQQHEIAVEIGNVPILLRTPNAGFRDRLASHYAGFLGDASNSKIEFDVDIISVPDEISRENPDSEDDVQVNTLILARQGGFLLHAASGIRNGRAFVFSGVSGAGKTTISHLAPPDVCLLTDEISYIRRDGEGYVACGTPFSGELERPGANCAAPINSLFLLAKGTENRIDPLPSREALRRLLRNVLFFAKDAELVDNVFRSAWEFVQRVPVRQLTFVPDARVWSMIE